MLTEKESQSPTDHKSHDGRKRPLWLSWLVLLGSFLFIYFFAVSLGPRLINYIPRMKKIVKVINEQDINANAYFYTEIEASAEGEQYLKDALSSGKSNYTNLTWPFMLGIFLCIFILFLGFRYIM